MTEHYLMTQYPAGYVLMKTFCEDHPDLMGERQARNIIANLHRQLPEVQKIFRKRLNRWHVHVPSYIEYMESEHPILEYA